MTLEIRVVEVVTLRDVVGEIMAAIKRLISFFLPENQKANSAEAPQLDDNKSPPDLGVAVGETVKSGESLG